MTEVPVSYLGRRMFLFGAVTAALPDAGAAAPAPVPTRPGACAEPLLASVYTGQVDPALCLVSEKYDGVRALWDGRVLRFRSGREVSAPRAFLDALPDESLDGELWLGRGRFDALSGIVRSAPGREADWRTLRYMVFEQPDGAGSFADRAESIVELAARSRCPQLVAAPQERIAGRAQLQRRLEAVVAGGGEGLMLHRAAAPATGGRGDVLMKLKPHLDAEAVVVAHRPGRGKYAGQVGALEVEAADRRRFVVGSGLTDGLRRDPPKPGESITYRYRELTPNGLPRFATFLRRHEAL